MKIRLLLLATAFAYHASYGQEENLRLPDYTPPPPEAAAITKYGDLQANEFNGLATYSLPLYSYKAGNVEVPITLNYAGAGVKVDDVPTWVGINWTLSAGGVITRSVRDLADEQAVARAFIYETDLQNFIGVQDADPSGYSQQLLSLISGTQLDNEPDIFQFSFGGYSGSFYFDEDWNARVFKRESPLKVEIANASGTNPKLDFLQRHEIVITTPDGTKYFFGGPGYTASTFRRYVTNNAPSKDTPNQVTAMYLTRIENPINGIVIFEYEGASESSPEIVISQKIEKLRRFQSSSANAYTLCESHPNSYGSCPAVVVRCTNTPSKNDFFSNTTVSTRTFGQKYLKRIYNPITDEEVNFFSRSLDNAHFKRVLDKIEVSKNSEIFKTIDFFYIGAQTAQNPWSNPDVSKRLFLEQVVFDKDNPDSESQGKKRNQVFTFEYDDPDGLPPRFDYAQDYLGYYNGQNGNIRSLPDNPYFNPWNIPDFFANRNPNFEMAKKGTLTKIIYPTGGYTHFDYGAKQAKAKISAQKNLYAYRNMQAIYPELVNNNFYADELPGMTPDGPGTPITVSETQTVEINTKMVIHNYAPGHLDDKIMVRVYRNNVKILDKTLNSDQPSGQLGNNTIIEVVPSSPYLVTFSPGYEYRIVLEVFNSTSLSPHPIEAFVSFTYFTGFQIVDDCGVLLKRITDFSALGQPENIKRFYYSDAMHIAAPDVENLPLAQAQAPAKTEFDFFAYLCDPSPCCGMYGANDEWVSFQWLLSDFIDYSNIPNAGLFENVTISYGGDNFENGGVEKTFKYLTDYSAAHLPTFPAPGNSGYSTEVAFNNLNVFYPQARNGSLIRERILRKAGNVLSKMQETSFKYLDVFQHKTISLVSKKLYDISFFGPGANINNSTSNYYIAHYLQESFDTQLESKTTKQYLEGVPLDETDETGYRQIVTQENYYYESFVGQPTNIVKNTSEGDTVETRLYYVDAGAHGSLPGNVGDQLDSDQLDRYQDLLNANIVSTPVQTESWKGTELLSRVRTTYSNSFITEDYDIFLDVFPQFIKFAKGSHNLKNKVEFLDYNGYGKPTLLKQNSGAQTMYQYNPKGQIVLKIENYTGMQPVQELIEEFDPDVLNNPSSNWCNMNAVYPDALVTRYHYDSLGRLTRIIDPKCQETTYRYNALNQLIEARDFEGNLIKSYDMNFAH